MKKGLSMSIRSVFAIGFVTVLAMTALAEAGRIAFDYLVSLESNQANYEACAKTEGGMRV